VIPRLGEAPEAPFPPPERALDEPDGLLAWGGDLSPRRLLRAYRRGIFPWYSEEDPLLWWCPSERCVIPTDAVHVSRRLARILRQGRFRLTADTAFAEVVDGCASTRRSTWIMPEMAAAYARLHELGHAHSIEAWQDGELAGGLYGVAIGRMFFGESMFSARRDASKAVLARGCAVLHHWGFPWLDAQLPSAHLARMGAVLLPRAGFLERLEALVDHPGRVGPWTSDFEETLSRLE
jgi:leucyl/phenylalanyl-tRNA--protein transferase